MKNHKVNIYLDIGLLCAMILAYLMGQNLNKQPPIGQKISILARKLSEYRPILVNGKFDGGYYFNTEDEVSITEITKNREALITATGEAIMEVQQFIRQFEELRSNYATLSADAMLAHQAIKKWVGVESYDLASCFETVAGRMRQCIDVLHNIAHNLPPDKCKAVAAAFLKPLLVNETKLAPDAHGDGTTSPIIEFPKPPVSDGTPEMGMPPTEKDGQ